MALWKDLFGGEKRGKKVPAMLHEAVMTQALNPQFYGVGLFQDTFSGRFENATIHAMLLFRRLRNGGDLGNELAQDVFGELFSNFDDALREMGTGDLRVGKKVKDLAKAFYGRAEAYDAALQVEDTQDNQMLVDAITRNVKLTPDGAERMARYMRAADALLTEQADGDFLKGSLQWPNSF